jgi:hypothetical protein
MFASATQKVGGMQFFPVQVGPPTEKAKKMQWLFAACAIFQLLMGIMVAIEFLNFVSGLIMCLGTAIAFFAWKENMNITYICWWGLMSTIGFVVGVASIFIGFAVRISTLVVKCNVPLSCLFGMIMAWTLYTDYEQTHDCTDMMTSWLRGLGLLKPKPILPAGNNPFFGGGVPQFGGVGQVTHLSWTKHWDDLTKNEQNAAHTLGWNKDSWEKHVPPPSNHKLWNDLNSAEQEALGVFGWTRQKWDMSIQFGDKESQVSTWAKSTYSQALGQAEGVMNYGAVGPGQKSVKHDPFLTH